MGIQHDLIITSTSGKKIRIRNLYKDDAEKAKSVIYESQKKSLTSSNNNQNNQGSLDVADQIAKLSSLKDQGILTQDEFDTQKKKLLGL